MKMTNIMCFVLLFLLTGYPVSAQDRYSSERTKINKFWIEKKTTEPDSVNLLQNQKQKIYFSYPHSSGSTLRLFLTRDKNSVLTAGILLPLSADSLENWYLNCLSELLLEWIRLDADENTAQIRSEQIDIRLNGVNLNSVNPNLLVKVASIFSETNKISLSVSKSRIGFSAESLQNANASISLPNRLDLLSGRTKEELDNDLAHRLNQPVYFSKPECSSGSQVQRFAGKELFPGFYSDRFGLIHNDRFSPVWDSAQPEATLRTLFSSYSGQTPDLTLKLVHHTYGSQTATYVIKFSSLIGNLGKNTDLFVGLESADSLTGDQVISVIAADRQFAHHHLLIVTLKPDLLFNQTEQSMISADLFTFIRTDNLKSLISGYRDKMPKYQILK